MRPLLSIAVFSMSLIAGLSASAETSVFTAREISLGRLLEQAINAQRLRKGKPAIEALTRQLQKAQVIYSSHILNGLLTSNACDHDYRDFRALQQLIKTSPRSIATAIPTSEVIGCPSATRGWSPGVMVQLWMQSPQHNKILFEEDGRSNIGCQVKQRGSLIAALCTLWIPNS
jgi:hypothetical protein